MAAAASRTTTSRARTGPIERASEILAVDATSPSGSASAAALTRLVRVGAVGTSGRAVTSASSAWRTCAPAPPAMRWDWRWDLRWLVTRRWWYLGRLATGRIRHLRHLAATGVLLLCGRVYLLMLLASVIAASWRRLTPFGRTSSLVLPLRCHRNRKLAKQS